MRAVAFGECMIELARGPDGTAKVGFGGDTLNTAVYLSRLGVPTGYMTALGTDAWSSDLRTAWAEEGLDLSLVATHPTRAPGLYAITTDSTGERSFTYWRDQSAARSFFETASVETFLLAAEVTELLYLSGITLAIFTPSQRRRIALLARAVRARGGLVAFDPNWRPRLWADASTFRLAIEEVAPAISVVLPGFEDEAAVWGDESAAATATRWKQLGVGEVVVKQGERGALVDGRWVHTTPVSALDSTGAGDSFNAGYLAMRLNGASSAAAASFASTLAAAVVQYPGAIMPREAMPVLPTILADTVPS